MSFPKLPPSTCNDFCLRFITRLPKILFLLIILRHIFFSISHYAFGFEYGSAFWGIGQLTIEFGDLAQLTHSAGCDASVRDLVSGEITCDPLGRPYNLMVPALVLARSLGVSHSLHGAIGGVQGVATVCLFIIFCITSVKSSNLLDKALIGAIPLVSLPWLLAIERGNTDLTMIGLMISFVWLFTFFVRTKSLPALVFSFLVALLSILFKLWTGPGLILFSVYILFCALVSGVSSRRKLGVLAAYFLGLLVSFLVIYLNSNHVFAHTESWFGNVSFGLDATYYSYELGEPGQKIIELRWLKIVICLMPMAWCLSCYEWKALRKSLLKFPIGNNAEDMYVLALFTFIPVYIYSRSWDYRLMILALCLPALFNLAASRQNLHISRAASVGIVLIGFVFFDNYFPFAFAFSNHYLAYLNIDLFNRDAMQSVSDILAQPALLGLLIGLTPFVLVNGARPALPASVLAK